MLPREELAVAQVPGGDELRLVSHGRDFIIMLGRDELMSSRMQYSEQLLAEMAFDRVGKPDARMLIGGYGMGFTLRAALARLAAGGQAVVAEIVPDILDWARGPMAEMTGASLQDPRVTVEICDVAAVIDDAADGTTPAYDAILLDVDNGPDGIVRADNQRLYSFAGLRSAKAALNPGGILAIWSAASDPRFTHRLQKAGFAVDEQRVRARPNNKGPHHVIWFARKV